MSRLVYTLVLLALLPWAVLHLLWRARRQPEYRQHWNERFGRFPARPDTARPLIWIHAVSVGETRAAQPLVAALRRRFPDHGVLLTHMTPTGRQTGAALFGDSVRQAYLPYDTPWAVARFLDHFRPCLGLVMETELWPNLVAACRRRHLPLLLVNARLSERSAARYRRVAPLTRGALGGLTAVGAQGRRDAERLTALGASAPVVTGNLKFDITPPPDQAALAEEFRRRVGPRPVFLCASTREGEEAEILAAWKTHPVTDTLLVIVPRHPQRFDTVAGAVAAAGLRVQRRSDGTSVEPGTDVWLGDSMGELFAYYGAADLAFVGGSLLQFGSQNLIEPCAAGVPVLIGPSTYNFAEAAREALAAGAAVQVANAAALIVKARELLADPAARAAMGEAGRAFAAGHRGATERTLQLIEAAIRATR
ncbi:MAG: lipid IV(A) 3-deoxy-D-manno-octulosonic acid transferase [Rhodocyclaceae bacterium]|nr:lipid IV(A) 3-deoxy-D-manno-octulosonic acid transferase [Rhodocyclaceae bacterium]